MEIEIKYKRQKNYSNTLCGPYAIYNTLLFLGKKPPPLASIKKRLKWKRHSGVWTKDFIKVMRSHATLARKQFNVSQWLKDGNGLVWRVCHPKRKLGHVFGIFGIQVARPRYMVLVVNLDNGIEWMELDALDDMLKGWNTTHIWKIK